MGQTFPVGILLLEETGVPEKTTNLPQVTASHRQTLSHNVVPSTPHISGI